MVIGTLILMLMTFAILWRAVGAFFGCENAKNLQKPVASEAHLPPTLLCRSETRGYCTDQSLHISVAALGWN